MIEQPGNASSSAAGIQGAGAWQPGHAWLSPSQPPEASSGGWASTLPRRTARFAPLQPATLGVYLFRHQGLLLGPEPRLQEKEKILFLGEHLEHPQSPVSEPQRTLIPDLGVC
ncbi:MAG: hypothetical protein AAB289_06820 [Chloroflexota bacterium]